MISEFPLFVFTTLGGVGAGFYAGSFFLRLDKKRDALIAAVLPLLLLAIGGIALFLHLGHPERMLNAFNNPAATLTIEVFASMAFGALAFVDALLVFAKDLHLRWLRFLGALAALVLTFVMGYAYFFYQSMPAWHAAPTIPMFVLGDLAGGFALAGAFFAKESGSRFDLATSIIEALAAIVFAWDAAVFSGAGFSPAPFAVAAVLFALAAVLAFMKRGAKGAGARRLVFVLAFAAVVIARYAFYAIL